MWEGKPHAKIRGTRWTLLLRQETVVKQADQKAAVQALPGVNSRSAAVVQERLFGTPRGLCCVAVLLDGCPDALDMSVCAMWMSRQAWKVGGIGGQGAKEAGC